MITCRFEVHPAPLVPARFLRQVRRRRSGRGRPSSLVRLGAPNDRVLDGAGSLRPTPACMIMVYVYTIGVGGGW
jgi:hypothetical protein